MDIAEFQQNASRERLMAKSFVEEGKIMVLWKRGEAVTLDGYQNMQSDTRIQKLCDVS